MNQRKVALRQWVKMGLVHSTKAGKNYLVDLDELESFLSGAAHENQ